MEIGSYQASDGTELRYREWRPEQCRAIVIHLHGVQSHSGWFLDSCEFLFRQGMRVISLDRRGAGMNQEARGDAPSHKAWIEDVARMAERARSESPGARLHLLGVCWGGKTAACLAALRPDLVDTLLLSTPGFAAKVGPGWKECLAISLCYAFRPRRRFRIPIHRAEMFTANPRRIEFIESDPLRLDLATARFMVESRRLDFLLSKIAPRITAPALLMLAGDDPIVDNEGTIALFRRFASAEKRTEMFGNARHLLEFEADNRPYLDALLAWVRDHS